MAKIIKATGEIMEVFPGNSSNFSLEEVQKIVGGLVELIYLPNSKEIMLLNEEGKLMQLPVNQKATELAKGKLGMWDVIVGDVLVCKKNEFK